MPTETRNRRFSRIAAAAIVGALALGTLTTPLAPAQSQVYFDFGPGGFGVGVGPLAAGYYSPYYPYYAPYYEPYYYRPYYHRW